ncbi:MAG: peptidoglycan binding domain-containing protein, partial [Lachnospiraceae bacterium]|nr:peptidoglycan binding domain-containing protein [Lachnospiraceae bacterium]
MKKSTFITVCGAVLVVFCGSRLALNAGQTKEQAAQVAAAQEDSTAEDSEAEEKSGVIAEHISIEGVDVSGMTETQAKQALQKKVDEKLASDFELSAGDSSLHATADDLQLSSDEDEIIQKAIGYAQSGNLIERFKESKRMDSGEGEDFALSFSPASYAVERFLKSHEEELSKEQINNSIVRKDGEFVFVKGESGSKVNVDNSVEAVREYFEESWDGSDCKIDLALDEIEPQGKEEDFAKIHDALGTYTTEYGGSPSGRKTNIINGAAKVNG